MAFIQITAELTGNGWIGEVTGNNSFGGEFATGSADFESAIEELRARVGKMLAPPTKVKAVVAVAPPQPPPTLPNQPAPRMPRGERHSGTSSREEQFFGDGDGATNSLRRK